MAKPYQEGEKWSIRPRIQGQPAAPAGRSALLARYERTPYNLAFTR